MGTISRKLFCILAVLFIFSAISLPAYADGHTVFGPKELTIKWWHIHLSFHKFKVDDPGDGVIIITKNTPNKKIRGGFVILNRRIIRLRKFLVGDDTVFDKDISLKSRNRLMVFLRGKPGASITIEIRKKSTIPPPEVTFLADPPSIKPGESSTLTWTTFNADSVSIDQGIGSVSLDGSLTVSPTETTTYTLTATGEGGTTTESVTITVHLPPTVTISADPETIHIGDSSTLSWSSTYADSCEIDHGIGIVDVSGSTTVSPTEATTYNITATGPGGTATESVTVSFFTPTVNISADPETIIPGDSSTLSWTSCDADSATIDQGIGAVPIEGSITVSPNQSTTHTITVEGPGGTATDSTEVVVIAPPEDVDYGLNDNEQQGGGGLVGKTIRILNGNNVEYRSEFRFPSPNRLGLSFHAFHNSRSTFSGSLGHGWTHTYEASLDPSFEIDGKSFIKIIDHTGRASYFLEEEAGVYKGAFKELTYVKEEAGDYIWYRLDGTRYGFSSTGKLTWIKDEKGNRLEITYNSNDRPETVTDTFTGRALAFNYNTDGLLEYITGPVTDAVSDGIWVSYGYDVNLNLASVTYSDGSGFDYFYTDPNDVCNLTEKRNKSGHLLNTWAYDAQDRATDNFSADGKGASINYVSVTQVDMTDAYGTLRTYTLGDIDGRKRVTAMSGPAGAPYSDSNAIRWVYDSMMRLIEVEHAGGTINQYQDYDDRGNPQTVKLAVGTPEEKTITYTYHPEMNTKLTQTEGSVLGGVNKITIWDYDNDYNVTPNENPTKLISYIIEKGVTKNLSGDVIPYEYITTFTYNSKGQALSIDGTLPGNGDTTSYTYNTTTGDLLSTTMPLIGSTTLSGYDTTGRPGRVTGVNGQSKSISYDGRGRITSITNNADGSTTNFTYNIAGQPESVTDPDGITRSFSYDTDYGRLIKIIDPEGNYIAYGYDSQGNRIEMSYHDPSDNRTYWRRYTYQQPDMMGKLWKVINPDDTYTEYGYDSAGNISSITDPSGNTTTYNYDPLNRLTTVIQPGNVTASYSYNIQDKLSVLTDAEGRATTYIYDDMGKLISTTSPDTGTVAFAYDEAGNLISKTDAKGTTVTYTYDSLNRLLATHFPDPSQDITHSYDQVTNGKGRLTGITDPSGSMAYEYDALGRIAQETRNIDGSDFTTEYIYSAGGLLAGITYPTGRTVTYNHNSTGKIAGASTTYNSNTTDLINNLTYLPFGPAKGMDMGTASAVNNLFDELYRMTVANPGAEKERTYSYNANGNITSINVTNNMDKNQTFTYDSLNRLLTATGVYGSISYTYDKIGNRLTKTIDDQTETYNYITGTNKLYEVAGPDPVTFTYDENGNTTGMGDRTFDYNQNNRLIRSEENGSTLGEYTYNGLGQKVIKQADGVTTLFHYDLNGNLIAESLSDGTFISEYLYMGNSRLAKVNSSDNAIYYYLNDHLGTPQIMTDASGTVVWEGIYKPFGEAGVNPNSSVVNNFRMPGQFFDQETGLHYNYFRDYHPGIGKYIEPDPIGLRGGINMYVYCMNDPVNLVDLLGLFSWQTFGYGLTEVSMGVLGFYGGILIGAGGAESIILPIIGAHMILEGALLFGAGVSDIVGAFYDRPPISYQLPPVIGGLLYPLPPKLSPRPKPIIWVPIPDETSQESVVGSTLPEDYQYDLSWLYYWNPDNPEEIDSNSSIPISVIGGFPPYTWHVSGNGFSLSLYKTEVPSNTLIADSTACGAATITITDKNGAPVKGYGRCTAGQWVLKGHYCGLGGSVDYYYDYDTLCGEQCFYFELISGNKKQYQETAATFGGKHEDCGLVPAICTEWNMNNCPEDYRDDNCIDGVFSAFYPYVCVPDSHPPNAYACFCVHKLSYYEWECP